MHPYVVNRDSAVLLLQLIFVVHLRLFSLPIDFIDKFYLILFAIKLSPETCLDLFGLFSPFPPSWRLILKHVLYVLSLYWK